MKNEETRKTFVLWLSRERVAKADSDSVRIEGRVEDVDTGRELRFRSVEQLISFLQGTIEQI